MQRYIALLRAINVGGHIVKMDALRKHFEALKFKNVATFIASGNVIFDAASGMTGDLESKIEVALRQALGYDVATFLRTPEELAAIGSHNAFVAAELAGSTLYVVFMKRSLSPALKKSLLNFSGPTDDFRVRGREVYWLVRGTFMDSEFSGGRLEKLIASPVTVRNITTVKRLVAKHPSPA